MIPVLAVLLYSSLAAATALLAAIPLAMRRRPPTPWLGWANGVAAGLMLGAAYVLMTRGLLLGSLAAAAGAAFGTGVVYLTHRLAGTSDLELNRLEEVSPDYPYRVLFVNTVHTAPEGIAIGVAMVIGQSFGASLALAIAVHNIAEASVVGAVLAGSGSRISRAVGAAAATRLSQVLLAVTAFAVVSAEPATLPWILGFAVGSLLYLVMADLLPECYRQTGHTSIALVTIVAMGIVVLLQALGRSA